MLTESLDRFWAKVDRSGDCWTWTLRPSRDGYGKFKANRKTYRAHRFIWEVLNGPTEPQVLHGCDNRLCVRPDHLHVGTHKDNMREMQVRVRAARGVRNGASKMTEEIVKAIRASIEPQRELAKKYGVSQGAISHARLGRNWSSLTFPSTPYPNQSKGNQNHA